MKVKRLLFLPETEHLPAEILLELEDKNGTWQIWRQHLHYVKDKDDIRDGLGPAFQELGRWLELSYGMDLISIVRA